MERHHDFAAVIAVNNSYLVCRRQAALCGYTAAGVYEPCVAFGNFNRKARVDHYGLIRSYAYRFAVCQRVNIRSRSRNRAIGRGVRVFIELFEIYLHFYHSFNLFVNISAADSSFPNAFKPNDITGFKRFFYIYYALI
jgi:hypothetical protein